MEYNPVNMQHAINIMERAKAHNSLSMSRFQSAPIEEPQYFVFAAKTEAELHACGNRACFAGHIAVSPEFLNSDFQGLKPGLDHHGAPRLRTTGGNIVQVSPTSIIGAWLGIPKNVAVKMILACPAQNRNDKFYIPDRTTPHIVYGVPWEDVTADHVLKVLRSIQTDGLSKTLQMWIDQFDGTEWVVPPNIAERLRLSIDHRDLND